MATKNTALRNALADAFGGLWDSGTLVIKDSGANTLVTFNLAVDSFEAADSGSTAMGGVPISATAAASGIADNAELISNGATYTITGFTVGESGTQIVLDNVDINSGQTVTLNSFTWTDNATV